MKNTEGYDRIPQRILVDGVDLLLESFVGLFSRIYNVKFLNFSVFQEE